MHRVTGQPGFIDVALEAAGLGANSELEAIANTFDWKPIDAIVSVIYSARDGRPSYPPLVMVKALLLQQWYALSDVRLEFMLRDSLSFRRFVGLAADDGTPDHSVVSRFRKALGERGLDRQLFEEVTRQLEAKGLILKTGTILDATLVTAAVRKPGIKEGKGATSPLDPDANFTRKNGKSYFGYKAHIAVDEGSGIIRDNVLTPAKTSESEMADGLIAGDEKAVYADKAYEKKERRRRLKSMGIKDRIMHRSHKHQARLPHWQAQRNRLIASVRAAVERPFGTFKRCYGYVRVRYVGLARNAVHLNLLCLAFNMRKAANLAG